MADDRICALLTQLPLFARLSEEQRRALADHFVRRQLAAGAEIFCEGDPADAFYIVASGQVQIVRAGAGEPPRILATLAPGSYFGEMGLVEEAPRMASAQMAVAGELLVMPKASFGAMLQALPNVAMQINGEIIRRHRKNVSGALDEDKR